MKSKNGDQEHINSKGGSCNYILRSSTMPVPRAVIPCYLGRLNEKLELCTTSPFPNPPSTQHSRICRAFLSNYSKSPIVIMLGSPLPFHSLPFSPRARVKLPLPLTSVIGHRVSSYTTYPAIHFRSLGRSVLLCCDASSRTDW